MSLLLPFPLTEANSKAIGISLEIQVPEPSWRKCFQLENHLYSLAKKVEARRRCYVKRALN